MSIVPEITGKKKYGILKGYTLFAPDKESKI